MDLALPYEEIFKQFSNEISLLVVENKASGWSLLQCAYLSDFFFSLTSLEEKYKNLNQEAKEISQKLFTLASLVDSDIVKLSFNYK